MQVDFYQLSRDPVERALALIAAKVLGAGERLLAVAEDPALLRRAAEALWSFRADGFLANGMAGDGHDQRQPILLSTALEPGNGARCVAFLDGVWREAEPAGDFTRAFLFFDEATVAGARGLWRELGQREGMSRRFWKQDGGRWVQAG